MWKEEKKKKGDGRGVEQVLSLSLTFLLKLAEIGLRADGIDFGESNPPDRVAGPAQPEDGVGQALGRVGAGGVGLRHTIAARASARASASAVVLSARLTLLCK